MRMPRIDPEALHLIEVIAIVIAAMFAGIAAVFAGFQLRELRLQNSADLVVRLDQQYSTDIDGRLEDALDSEPTTLILKKDGGKFTVEQVDGYLNQYETLDDFYQGDLITCRMIYDEFSYDLENAYKNIEVMNEVAVERKDDPSVWQGFLDLGARFDHGYRC